MGQETIPLDHQPRRTVSMWAVPAPAFDHVVLRALTHVRLVGLVNRLNDEEAADLDDGPRLQWLWAVEHRQPNRLRWFEMVGRVRQRSANPVSADL